MMKDYIKKVIAFFLLTVASLMGIQPIQTKADSITIAGNMRLNEIKDVDIDGRHYDAILFRVCKMETASGEDLSYVILQGLKTREDSLVIPAYIEGMPVKEIQSTHESTLEYMTTLFHHDNAGYYLWSENNEKVYDTITIPSTLKKIDGLRNVKVKKMVIPATVEYFGGGNQIEQVQIQGKNTELGMSAFAKSQLKKISLPKGYQGKIGDNAFANCQLTSFRWPAYKKNIKSRMGKYLLSDCKKLKKITFESGTKQVYVPECCFDGCRKLKQLVFPKSIQKVTYNWQLYAGNKSANSPGTLIFKGKKTKLQGIKAGTHLADVSHDDESYFENKTLVCTGKILAPKKSKAIQYAKKAYFVKKILKSKDPDTSWEDQGREGFKLAKIKWGYLK